MSNGGFKPGDQLYFYIYNAALPEFEELHEVGTGEELGDSMHFRTWGPPHIVRCQGEIENTNHDVSRRNEMDGFLDLAKKLIKSVDNGHLFCSAPQSFSC